MSKMAILYKSDLFSDTRRPNLLPIPFLHLFRLFFKQRNRLQLNVPRVESRVSEGKRMKFMELVCLKTVGQDVGL